MSERYVASTALLLRARGNNATREDEVRAALSGMTKADALDLLAVVASDMMSERDAMGTELNERSEPAVRVQREEISVEKLLDMYHSGMTWKQIAAKLRCTTSVVYGRVQRALRDRKDLVYKARVYNTPEAVAARHAGAGSE